MLPNWSIVGTFISTSKSIAMTRKEQLANLKKIKQLREYVDDLMNDLTTQYPQPDGRQYLYGEVITLQRINRAIADYNHCVRQRNEYIATTNRRVESLKFKDTLSYDRYRTIKRSR